MTKKHKNKLGRTIIIITRLLAIFVGGYIFCIDPAITLIANKCALTSGIIIYNIIKIIAAPFVTSSIIIVGLAMNDMLNE